MLNDWGYETAQAVPHILTPERFQILTRGEMCATDGQVEAAINAVEDAARTWCGWHIAPVLECTYTGDGEGDMLHLPALGVKSIARVTVADIEVAPNSYMWRPSGLVKFAHPLPDVWRCVTVDYTAGVDGAAAASVIAEIVANALTAAIGISSESAGQVSLTYNKTGDGVTGGFRLSNAAKDALAFWKLPKAL